ncbi:MAG: transcriptional regulator BetI [Rhodospirillaceae bacterium]|nr:transcriptional regulator BetI [Rhodospirillaceae bacterium]
MRTSIEKIRRRDLVEAAFQTFLDHGMNGTTVARIGEQAGMSHGIVNYYFKSKDQLLSAVIRHAFALILRQAVDRMRLATTPRERISAIIAGNFSEDLFNRETAAAWISFYAEVATRPEFERLQDTFYRRLHSNLLHDLKKITTPAEAENIALGISVWIDGLWLRCAMRRMGVERDAAIAAIESYVDTSLAQANNTASGTTRKSPARRRAAVPANRR